MRGTLGKTTDPSDTACKVTSFERDGNEIFINTRIGNLKPINQLRIAVNPNPFTRRYDEQQLCLCTWLGFCSDSLMGYRYMVNGCEEKRMELCLLGLYEVYGQKDNVQRSWPTFMPAV